MIYSRELSVKTNARILMRQMFAGILIPLPFVTIGLGMFFSGIKNGAWVSWVLGLLIFLFAVWIGYVLIRKALAPMEHVKKLFMKNDVFVDPPACRSVEDLALQKFNGELKPALRYIAETPELYRYERKAYLSALHSYETDYLREFYGKDPLRVTLEGKTKELTLAMLEEEGLPLCSHDPESTCYQLLKKCCTLKTAPSYLPDGSESYRLHFGDMGSFECSAALYNDTIEGDGFYIIRGPFSGAICMVYHTLDWHLDEELAEFLQ